MKGEYVMPLIPFSGPLDFETIYRKYHRSVYNYIYGQILHREVTEDLTADVFVAAASNLSRFDPARGDFAAWLFYHCAEHNLELSDAGFDPIGGMPRGTAGEFLLRDKVVG